MDDQALGPDPERRAYWVAGLATARARVGDISSTDVSDIAAASGGDPGVLDLAETHVESADLEVSTARRAALLLRRARQTIDPSQAS